MIRTNIIFFKESTVNELKNEMRLSYKDPSGSLPTFCSFIVAFIE